MVARVRLFQLDDGSAEIGEHLGGPWSGELKDPNAGERRLVADSALSSMCACSPSRQRFIVLFY
jgi:hypothetical protein